ncbi:hypothetical protein CGJ94_16905, partial [Vibrio parahaemolyticus]
MNKFKLRLPVLLGAMAAIAAPLAQAELLEYSFNTPDGAERTLSPSTVYANPTGNIKFALSAGIDRKVKISIVRPDGSVVNSATSHLLGGADRITVNGKSYYGAELELAAPGEGEYSFKAEILTSVGDSVQTDTYPIIVDITPPVISGEIQWVRSGFSMGSIDVFNHGYAGKELRLEGIDDDSGISSAKFFTIDSSGQKRETNASLDTVQGVASLPVGSAVSSSMAPENQAEYTIGFSISDEAGNQTEISRVSTIDKVVPQVWTEVFDSSEGIWKPYTSGMNVYENPVQIRYKRRKQEHTAFNGTKYGWGDTTYDSEDNEFIYRNVSLNY